MMFFWWALPALLVLLAIASGRANTTQAALLGLLAALPVAWLTGPSAVGAPVLGEALWRGVWIGAVIAPYILGGLLFWQVAARAPQVAATPAGPGTEDPLARRRLAFFACFLVGPFAESATGFGVGMLGTVVLLRPLGLAPRHLMVFALLSQSLIPWGAMSSGTILAAAYARLPPAVLGLYTLLPAVLLMGVWLWLFWATARAAGLPGTVGQRLEEAGWVAAGLGLLGLSTHFLGPETALLAAYGPLIVLRYLRDQRPDWRQARAAAARAAPYAALIGGLAVSRLAPGAREALGSLGRVAPFADLPAWSPLYHAGSWLVAGALLTALLRRQTAWLGQECRHAWRTGQHAVLAVFLFAMMAEVLTVSGISGAFAQSTLQAFGEKAILLAPPVSGLFGVLTNSGNPANSLFLPSHVTLALEAGLSVPLVAALQHASGTSLGLFSPVRMSIAAGLAGGRGQERQVYRGLLPYAAMALLVLLVFALFVISPGAASAVSVVTSRGI